MQSIRTFIAFEVGNDVRARVADLTKRLKKSSADVRWVDPAQMHITLKFLGDVPNVEVPDVCRVVSEVADEFEPFELEFAGAGAFPNVSNPKTLWIGIAPGEGFDRLAAMNDRLESRLHDELGFARERRKFTPHLTIGRVNNTTESQAELTTILTENASFDAALTEVDELLVFASYLERNGPLYTVMGRAEMKY